MSSPGPEPACLERRIDTHVPDAPNKVLLGRWLLSVWPKGFKKKSLG